jgi:hypothetical protein
MRDVERRAAREPPVGDGDEVLAGLGPLPIGEKSHERGVVLGERAGRDTLHVGVAGGQALAEKARPYLRNPEYVAEWVVDGFAVQRLARPEHGVLDGGQLRGHVALEDEEGVELEEVGVVGPGDHLRFRDGGRAQLADPAEVVGAPGEDVKHPVRAPVEGRFERSHAAFDRPRGRRRRLDVEGEKEEPSVPCLQVVAAVVDVEIRVLDELPVREGVGVRVGREVGATAAGGAEKLRTPREPERPGNRAQACECRSSGCHRLVPSKAGIVIRFSPPQTSVTRPNPTREYLSLSPPMGDNEAIHAPEFRCHVRPTPDPIRDPVAARRSLCCSVRRLRYVSNVRAVGR